MKQFLVFSILFLTFVSFTKLKSLDIYADSWKLEKIVSPSAKAVTHFESIWFLTPDGRSGNFIPNDNELYFNGKWQRKKDLLVIGYGEEKQKYKIVNWTDSLIVLGLDKIRLYFRK